MTDTNPTDAEVDAGVASDIIDRMKFHEVLVLLQDSDHWNNLCEEILAQAIGNGDVREGEAVDDLAADRIVDMIADGDLAGAVEELRRAFPECRTLAMQRRIAAGRGRQAHLL